MATPWEISGDDLELWAQRREAQAQLPVLVRRLLLATTPLRTIDIRGHAGVGLSGWDGEVRSGIETPWCPAGLSYWEFSVTADNDKLVSDFRKRQTLGSREATYVAVVGRRYAYRKGKRDWERVRRDEGPWHDVRLLDADDLSTWLGDSPSTSLWMANELGKPVDGLVLPEHYLAEWSARTEPPLPVDLLLLGETRREAAQQLRACATSLRPVGSVCIEGVPDDEARAFALMALSADPSIAARTAVIRSKTAWEWLLRESRPESPLVLLQDFEGIAPNSGRHTALTVTPATATARCDIKLRLESYLPRDALQKRLLDFGMRADDAGKLVREASARLADLRRLLSQEALPEWARAQPASLWIPMLLLRRWMPRFEADRRVVKSMSADPLELERMGEALSSLPDSPLRRAEEWPGEVTWEWSAPEPIWRQISHRVPSGDLLKFRGVAIEVLSTDDPRYDVPAAERFIHGISDRRSRPSARLREGIAHTLARLGNPREGDSGAPLSDGRAIAVSVVRAVLLPSWRRWASCAGELPLLAEAAPGEFLRALESSLSDTEGCDRLLRESEGATGQTPHVALLWALERIAWDPRWMPRCVDALAVLAARDPGGNVHPRPLSTLHNILAAIAPQTAATLDVRLAAIRRVVTHEPDVGWSLVMAILRHSKGRLVMQAHRPEYLPDPGMPDPGRPEVAPAVLRETVDLAITMAMSTPIRWSDLLNSSWNDDVLENLWTAFEVQEPSITAGRIDLLHTLRQHRAVALARGDTKHLERIDRISKRLEPRDLVGRSAWLFGPSSLFSFSADIEEAQRLEAQARDEVLRSLWASKARWRQLGYLVSTAQDSRSLGRHLVGSPFERGLLERVRRRPLAPALRSVQVPFLLTLLGRLGDDWAHKFLQDLIKHGRRDEAEEVLLSSPLFPRWWALAERIGGDVAETYWSRVDVIGFQGLSADQCVFAAGRLIEHDRGAALVRALPSIREQRLPSSVIIRALAQIGDDANLPGVDDAIWASDFAWHVEQAFHALDQADDIPAETIAVLELRLLGPILASHRSARALFRLLGEQPARFVELLCMLYGPEDVPPPQEVDSAVQHRARAAWEILHKWRGFPGEMVEGLEREHRVEAWALDVFAESAAVGRGRVARSEVGEVLARVPTAMDGDWPCLAARRMLEREPDDDLARAIHTAKRNARGVVRRSMGEGGAQERALASHYRMSADRLRAEWPRTAAVLDELADSYEADATLEDAPARTIRERWGIDPNYSYRNVMTEAPTQTAPSHRVEKLLLHGMTFARKTEAALGARLTLLVGDNSAGKTVVLDALWWALTGSWTRGVPLIPDARANGTAMIGIRFDDEREHHARFDPKTERWSRPDAWKGAGVLVVYARIDGGFSVYEPIQGNALRLTAAEIFDGLRKGGSSACNGLVEDVPNWQLRQRALFGDLNRALAVLSPPGERLAFGDPVRASVNDARDIPTVTLPYGSIPITHASASVKRITSLAYALLWAWHEHGERARLAQESPVRNVVVLVDEIEAHLHPEWQRRILPGVLDALGEVSPDVSVQTVVVTHSPLVVASVEPRFDRSQDMLLHMRLDGSEVLIEALRFDKEGDFSAWLTSPAFGLRSTRSVDAEDAIAKASELAASEDAPLDALRAADEALTRALSPTDPFFVRWDFHLRRKGVRK